MPALLAVLLDDAVACLLGGVCVHTEGADVEVAPDRPPVQTLVVDGVGLQLVDSGDGVRLFGHVCLLSSSRTTGSIRFTPSTRSSRFSFPAQLKNASPRSPSYPSLPRRSRSSAASSASTSSH